MTSRRRRLLVSVGLVISATAITSSASSATHPKLLFDAADVPALQARLAGPMKKIRDAFATGTVFPFESPPGLPKTFDPAFSDYASDPRALADTVASYAFAALMFDAGGAGVDATTTAHAKQLGHDYLIGACKYANWNVPTSDSSDPDLNLAHYLFSVSLAYDWLYPTLTDAERTLCRQKIETEGKKMYDAAKVPSSIWWADEYLQNHCWINHSALGLSALVLKDDSTLDVSPWLATATTALEKVRTVIDPIAGGAWHEGIGYSNYGMDALAPFSWANVKLVGGTDFADAGLVRDYPRMRLFAAPPSPKHSKEYPVWGDFSGFDGDDNTLAFVRLGARKQKDGVAQWFADRFTDGGASGKTYLTSYPPSQRGLFLSVIFADDSIKATPPPAGVGAWTLDYFAKDLSLFLARSGFGDDGTLLAFKTGVFGGHANWDRLKAKGAPGGGLNPGHDHDDDMNVWLFSDGEWLTTLVPGYWIGRANGSPEANRTKYANSLHVDGKGQLGDGPRLDYYTGLPWFFDRSSTMPMQGSTAHEAYVLGAGSGLYDATLGLTAFGRSILFVDRTIPLVRDVIAGKGVHRYDVIWHAVDDATRDGAWLKLTAKNDRVLGVKVIAPTDFDVTTEAQTADNLFRFDPDSKMTAVYVHPTTDVDAVTFLSALVPSRGATWATKPTVDPIDATVGHGVTMTGIGGSTDVLDVVFNDAPSGKSAAKGLEVTGMAGMRKTSAGKTLRSMLAAGSTLAIDGIPWIEVLAGAPASIEVEPTATGVAVSGEATKIRVLAPSASVVTYNGVEVPFDRDGDHVIIPKEGGSLGDSGDSGAGGDGGDASSGDARDPDAGSATPMGEGSGGCGCVVPARGEGAATTAAATAVASIFVLGQLRRRRRACYRRRSRAHR